MEDKIIREAQKLLDKIKNIQGEKLIILFSIQPEVLPLHFTLNEFGNFEEPGSYSKCVDEITKVINTGGTLELFNFFQGREIIYGFVLKNGSWTCVSAEEMELVYNYLNDNYLHVNLKNVGFCDLQRG